MSADQDVGESLGFRTDERRALLRLGRESADRGDYGRAMEALEKAEAMGTKSADTALLRFRIAIGRGGEEGVVDAIRGLCDVGDPVERTWLRRAHSIVDGGPDWTPQRRYETHRLLDESAGVDPERIERRFPGAGAREAASVLSLPTEDELMALEKSEGGAALDPDDIALPPDVSPLPFPGADASGDSEIGSEEIAPDVPDDDPFEAAYQSSAQRERTEKVLAKGERGEGKRNGDAGRVFHADSGEDPDAVISAFIEAELGAVRANGALGADDAKHLFELGTFFLATEQFHQAEKAFYESMEHDEFRLQSAEGLVEALFRSGNSRGAMMLGKLMRQAYFEGVEVSRTIGVTYWFGRAAEAEGLIPTAREAYEEVRAVDEDFDGVACRLAALPK